jgi:polysaccharide transporter, PST family
VSRSDDRYFAEETVSDDLGRASLRSGAIMMAARVVNIAVQLGSTILIARMLEPRDFGLAAMVLAFTVFAPFLVDLGTTDAVTHKRDLSRQHVSTLFWLNVSVGSVLTLLFAAASGVLAATFGEASLVGIALVASLTFVLTASSVQHYALMRRSMEFDRIAVNDVTANVIASVVAIAAALSGAGYWALILKPLLTIALMSIGVWFLCPWTPGHGLHAHRHTDALRRPHRRGMAVRRRSARPLSICEPALFEPDRRPVRVDL